MASAFRPCPCCGVDGPAGEVCVACGGRPSGDPIVGMNLAGRYLIQELMFVGGMGRVYRAQQRLLDRTVAIKFVHPHLAASRSATTRFLGEARALSRVVHPNVVNVFDFGRAALSEGGHLYLVMEYVAGPSLAAVLREGPMPIGRIASVLRQTLDALGEAHALGVTHRDVKPDNILLVPKRGGGDLVKVIDFGLAFVDQRRLTQAGRAVGTPSYMSPEVCSGAPPSPSADLYAVGVLLFEMLTGTLPFPYLDPATVIRAQVSAPRPDPRTVAPHREISGRMAEVCGRAIAIEPERRFQDAEMFAEAIVRAAGTRGSRSDLWLLPTSDAPRPRKGSVPPREGPK